MTQIFISYSRKDIAFIEQLSVDLKAAGLGAWYDLTGLEGGAHWSREIEKAIKESEYVLLVLSPDSVVSSWVEEEILFARNLKRKIVPLFYKDCELPFGFYTVNFIDVRDGNYQKNYKEILRALGVKPSGREAAEKIAREKVEKATAEKTRLEIEEKARQKDAKEKAKRDADENSAREKSNALKPKVQKPQDNSNTILGIVGFIVLMVGVVFVTILVIWLSSLNGTPAAPVSISSRTPLPEISLPITPSRIAVPSKMPTKIPTKVFTPTAIPLPTATPVIFNPHPDSADYIDPYGVSMRLVPAGEFTMGNDYLDDSTKPAHKVSLDAFYMDTYEVTNVLYKACVEAGGCTSPDYTGSNTNPYEDSQYKNHPVVKMNWYQSQAYCEWRGGSLPTEAQWEKAARGTDGRSFPWGSGNANCDLANYCGHDTTEVGSYERGKSPYGIYDLSGNAAEWTADWYDAYPGNTVSYEKKYKVVRSATYIFYDDYLRTYFRAFTDPNASSSLMSGLRYDNALGFRCALSVQQ